MAICLDKLMAVDVLSCGLASSNKPEVIHPKASWVRRGQQAIDKHCKRDSVVFYRRVKGNVVFGGVSQTVAKATKGQECTQEGTPADKSEEEAIIASPYAIINPDTVMVYSLNAIIAHPTMVAPWRPPNVAGFTVLGRHVHSRICLAS